VALKNVAHRYFFGSIESLVGVTHGLGDGIFSSDLVTVKLSNADCHVLFLYAPCDSFLLKRVSSLSHFLTEDLFQLAAPFLNMVFFSACTWLDNIIYVGLMSVREDVSVG
jgi:hypothetical protein